MIVFCSFDRFGVKIKRRIQESYRDIKIQSEIDDENKKVIFNTDKQRNNKPSV